MWNSRGTDSWQDLLLVLTLRLLRVFKIINFIRLLLLIAPSLLVKLNPDAIGTRDGLVLTENPSTGEPVPITTVQDFEEAKAELIQRKIHS